MKLPSKTPPFLEHFLIVSDFTAFQARATHLIACKIFMPLIISDAIVKASILETANHSMRV